MCAESNHDRWLHEVGFFAGEDIDHIALVEGVGGEFLFGHASKDTGDGVESSVEEVERLTSRLRELEGTGHPDEDTTRLEILEDMLHAQATYRLHIFRQDGLRERARINRDLAVVDRLLSARKSVSHGEER